MWCRTAIEFAGLFTREAHVSNAKPSQQTTIVPGRILLERMSLLGFARQVLHEALRHVDRLQFTGLLPWPLILMNMFF